MVQLSTSYVQLRGGFNAAAGFMALPVGDEEWFLCSIIMSGPDLLLLSCLQTVCFCWRACFCWGVFFNEAVKVLSALKLEGNISPCLSF